MKLPMTSTVRPPKRIMPIVSTLQENIYNEKNVVIHLKRTQCHAYKETDMISIGDDMHEDDEEILDIVDGRCLILTLKSTWSNHLREIIYE